MRALVEVKFDGIAILDHSPELIGGHFAEQAYGFAYMKALKNRAEAEA
jgi:mannonate dehydratase